MIFGQKRKTPVPALIVPGFDSVAVAISQAATLTASEQREQQSFIEHVREQALHIVSHLADTIIEGKLEEGELPSDLLDGLMLEALDGLDDDDSDIEGALAGSIQDALSSFDVDDSVINEMFSDNVDAADAAIEAAAATIIANMPDEGEPLDEFAREFIFGEPDDIEEGFDSISGKRLTKAQTKAKVGAFSHKKVGGRKVAYKGVLAIRKGIKTIVNKRLPGQKIRQSADQKQAIKKARLKAQTANSIRQRVKSFKKGRKMGLY